MEQKTTQRETDKRYVVSWYQDDGLGFRTPPILFRENETAKVEAVLIYAGMSEVVSLEVLQ